ncbi:hypothetical protein [Acutalibacter caecimuris]|uniref:hypothetical protein n=1 Tax=Acutalibacter caecimuris TaxID=3093657 RepID=UPI002AC9075B|nr:hypothetical protein [Acutalibacter sp. M00118]
MKSKAPLVMMEQMVMILVFALAAALCLQAFVLSDGMSRQAQRRDQAVLLCQNLAEQVKSYEYYRRNGGPSLAGEGKLSAPAVLYYDGEGLQTDAPAAYRLEARLLPEELSTLGRAEVRAYEEESGKELYSLTFAWQKGGSANG